MQYRGKIILFLLVTSTLNFYGQVVSHQVLVPLASIGNFTYYNVSQTIGEPMVEILQCEDYHLTQGFQQPSIKATIPDDDRGSGVEVYPNPVINALKVEFLGVERTNFELVIFGLDGTMFYRRDISCGREHRSIETIDMSRYKKGMYFVRIRSIDERIMRLFKIEKM